MKTIITVIGTRPEALKLAPVITAFSTNPYFINKICITSQHTLDNLLIHMDIQASYKLEPIETQGELDESVVSMLGQLGSILKKSRPDLLIVQGDTTTAFVAALAGFYARIPVAHVEAGLRTGNMQTPWPEEMHRCLIDKISTYYFTPTKQAKANLIKEGVISDNIWVVGNTSIDSLRLIYEKPSQAEIGYKEPFILVTLHRRENQYTVLQEICHALRLLAQQFPAIKILFCLHPNPAVCEPVKTILSHIPNIECIAPMDHISFIHLLKTCLFVITDSGGIQEEITFMGKPILIIRDTTERPEVLEAGTGLLIGTSKENIIKMVSKLLKHPTLLATMSKVHFPYGKGYAAQKIVYILEKILKKKMV